MPFLNQEGEEVSKGTSISSTRVVELASSDGPVHTVEIGGLVNTSSVLGAESKSAGADEPFRQVDKTDDVLVEAVANGDNTVEVTFSQAAGVSTYIEAQSEDRDVRLVVEGF
jgi:hypothetical protein